MNENELIEIVHTYISTKEFPKQCGKCGKLYDTFGDYIKCTVDVGLLTEHDADLENWDPAELIGELALSNCSCGNTLSISTMKMPQQAFLSLMLWIKLEALQQKIPVQSLLKQLKQKIRQLEIDIQKGNSSKK